MIWRRSVAKAVTALLYLSWRRPEGAARTSGLKSHPRLRHMVRFAQFGVLMA